MYLQRPANKYGNRSTVYAGRSYHSMAEANYAAELDLRKKAGEIIGWDPQVRLPLSIVMVDGYPVLTIREPLELKEEGLTFFPITNYYVDFRVRYPDGTCEFVEVKGLETKDWQIKWRLVEAYFHGSTTVRLVVEKCQSSWRYYKSFKPKSYGK